MSRYVDPCFIDGCDGRVHGRSKYCAKHEYRAHSHGHPLQLPMTYKLSEPVQRLKRWEKTPEGRKAIDAATAHYTRLAMKRQEEASEAYREMIRTGIKVDRAHNQATDIIAEVSSSKDHRKTVVELMALGMLLEETPQQFRSDKAFLCQATHVFLRGSTARAKYKYRPNRGRPVAVTRYLRKDTRLELGKWLTREVCYFGVMVHRQWMKDAAEEKQGRNKVYTAIRGEAVAT